MTRYAQVKTLAPILICSMKIFIQILGQKQEGKGTEEAVENRNYLAKRMTEEVTQITRILEDSHVGKDQVRYRTVHVHKV